MGGFEAFVLRLGRGAYLAAAVLGALATVGGVLAFVIGSLQRPMPVPAEPVSEPSPTALSLDKVEAVAKERPELARPFDSDNCFKGQLVELPISAKDLFSGSQYAWDDELETYCESPTDYGCLKQGKRLLKVGMWRQFIGALQETSPVDPPEALAMTETFLKTLPLEARLRLFRPAMFAANQAHIAMVETSAKATSDYEAAVALYERDAAEVGERKTVLMGVGANMVGGGVSAMVVASLLLAILAIERHLRR
jgi:hypothetical protein